MKYLTISAKIKQVDDLSKETVAAFSRFCKGVMHLRTKEKLAINFRKVTI